MRTSALILLATLALAACGEPASSARTTQTKDGATVGVEVTDAWCRATPNGARTGACYATFRAVGADDRLVAVATSSAATAEVHDMEERDGMMRMSAMPEGLPLPEGRDVTLAPGATHIMLTGLTSPLRAGEQVPMVMTFASGRTLELLLPVRMGAGR
ncbi:MAG TPA: copper chaperone PCu(A)C [Brevundimonas sp.]|jgi:copper(I)-binding protein|uniref:copper chaperone PCu(A)C n=1 Tax=Brevundimonas sp. TaxID=1871086 RepID=UPI002DF66B98|nr:copper chaperone PCu(A)C [Brevundimonas sp.]